MNSGQQTLLIRNSLQYWASTIRSSLVSAAQIASLCFIDIFEISASASLPRGVMLSE